MERAIIMNELDNVATALVSLDVGKVSVHIGEKSIEIELKEAVLIGHKFSLKYIGKGENVIKYGQIIGKASAPIESGRHVHTHNVESLRGRGDLSLTKNQEGGKENEGGT